MLKIILATKSPYRQEAFKSLGLDFIAEGSKIDENFLNRPSDPKKLVLELAKRKAKSIACKHKTGIIIGFDSIGYASGKILEKPKTRQEIIDRLKMLSGSFLYFYTGIWMINVFKKKALKKVVKTKIFMRKISDFEIKRYLDQDQNWNTYAIGFDPARNYSMTFADRILGSYNNFLCGLPLEVIVKMLDKIKN